MKDQRIDTVKSQILGGENLDRHFFHPGENTYMYKKINALLFLNKYTKTKRINAATAEMKRSREIKFVEK